MKISACPFCKSADVKVTSTRVEIPYHGYSSWFFAFVRCNGCNAHSSHHPVGFTEGSDRARALAVASWNAASAPKKSLGRRILALIGRRA